jgi:outer membrane immunogenic protein
LQGGQIGYNWQFGGFLAGIEGDLSFSGIDGDAFFGGKNVESELDWMATVRGRAGALVADGVLVYTTVGVAWGDWNDRVPALGIRASNTYVGYTAGGGVEAAISSKMTVKLEYQFLDFGDESHSWNVGGVPGTANFDHQLHTVRLGVNFKLN